MLVLSVTRRIYFILFAFLSAWCTAQFTGERPVYEWDASLFHGTIARHNPDMTHLIRGHPSGLILGWNRKRFGEHDWEAWFGYPDTGFTFVYQDMANPVLGDNYGLYAHYNFYFFNRRFQLRIGQGLAYNTLPYDRETNFRNVAYGSHILSSTLIMANYRIENIWKSLGLQMGLSLIHYSNANVRAPNASTNSIVWNMGALYRLDAPVPKAFIRPAEPAVARDWGGLNWSVVLRAGVNEGDVLGSGRFGFVVPSIMVDRRVSKLSTLQAGAEVFLTPFLKEYIRFQAASFPERGIAPGTDWRRAGLYLGHELHVNRLSLITQLGYYAYYPVAFETRFYNRTGLRYYIRDNWFAAVTLKSHAAAAEAVEWGLGFRW